MNNVIALVVALLVIIGGGAYFLAGQGDQQEVTQVDEDSLFEQLQDKVAEKEAEEAMMKKEEGVMEKHEGDSMEKMEKTETEDAMMKKEAGDSMEKESDAMIKKDTEVMEKKEEVMEKEDVMIKEEPVSTGPGVFKAYSPQAVASAEGDVVIGFFADWCPSCRALTSDINSDPSAIPSGLTILEANYDSETDLKKKHGVTTQHTLVQVDRNGDKIQSWRGGNTLSSVISKI